MFVRKPIAWLLSGLMLLQTVPAFAAEGDAVVTSEEAVVQSVFSDVEGHWAQKSIDTWSDLEVVKGFDGKFAPDNNMIRGDIAVVMDRIMDYVVSGENQYTDLDDTYYTDALLKATEAGVIQGFEGKVRPQDNITREEMIVVLARALHIDGVDGDTDFADDASISDWAKPYVAAFAQRGIIVGMDGAVNPQRVVTRAEVITMLDRGISLMATEKAYAEDVDGTVVVNTADTVLSDMTIAGDLIIAEGVDDGDVELNDVVVEGNVIVKGGGEHSIHFNNVTVNGGLVVSRHHGAVRVVASGKTTISMVVVGGQTIIQATDITGGLIGKVAIETAEDVTFLGDCTAIEATIPGVSLTVDGKVDALILPEGGSVNGEDFEADTALKNDEIPPLEKKPSSTGGSTGGSSGGSSGGGGGSSVTTYDVALASADNGALTVDDNTVAAGVDVTVTVTPDDGYLADVDSALVVSTEYPEDSAYQITADTALLNIAGGSFGFDMPAYDVTVSFGFVSIDEVEGVSTITVDDGITNGAITAPGYALTGETVTATVTPDHGYITNGATAPTVVHADYPNDSAYEITPDTTLLPISGGTMSFTMPDYPVLLSAVFEDAPAELRTITFVANGGSATADQMVFDDACVAVPAVPTQEGYDFGGWYTDVTLKDAYDFETPVSGNLVLYARWVSRFNADVVDARFAEGYPSAAFRVEDGMNTSTLDIQVQIPSASAENPVEVFVAIDPYHYEHDETPSSDLVIKGLVSETWAYQEYQPYECITDSETHTLTTRVGKGIDTDRDIAIYIVLKDATSTSETPTAMLFTADMVEALDTYGGYCNFIFYDEENQQLVANIDEIMADNTPVLSDFTILDGYHGDPIDVSISNITMEYYTEGYMDSTFLFFDLSAPLDLDPLDPYRLTYSGDWLEDENANGINADSFGWRDIEPFSSRTNAAFHSADGHHVAFDMNDLYFVDMWNDNNMTIKDATGSTVEVEVSESWMDGDGGMYFYAYIEEGTAPYTVQLETYTDLCNETGANYISDPSTEDSIVFDFEHATATLDTDNIDGVAYRRVSVEIPVNCDKNQNTNLLAHWFSLVAPDGATYAGRGIVWPNARSWGENYSKYMDLKSFALPQGTDITGWTLSYADPREPGDSSYRTGDPLGFTYESGAPLADSDFDVVIQSVG